MLRSLLIICLLTSCGLPDPAVNYKYQVVGGDPCDISILVNGETKSYSNQTLPFTYEAITEDDKFDLRMEVTKLTDTTGLAMTIYIKDEEEASFISPEATVPPRTMNAVITASYKD